MEWYWYVGIILTIPVGLALCLFLIGLMSHFWHYGKEGGIDSYHRRHSPPTQEGGSVFDPPGEMDDDDRPLTEEDIKRIENQLEGDAGESQKNYNKYGGKFFRDNHN